MAVEQVRKESNYIHWRETGLDVTGTNSSSAVPVATANTGSYQVVWSGVTGTFTAELQVSHDGTNWDAVTGTSEVSSGAAGSYSKSVGDMPGLQARLTVTSAATAGTAVLHFVSKKGTNS